MKQNGESIYATAASPFAKLAWGRATQKRLANGRTRLYLHIFDWPADGRLMLPLQVSKTPAAKLLACGKLLSTTVGGDQLTINVGAQAPDQIATVVALDLDGTWHVTAN